MTGYSREGFLHMEWTWCTPTSSNGTQAQVGPETDGEALLPVRIQVPRRPAKNSRVVFTTGTMKFEGKPASLGTAYDITERKNSRNSFASPTRWRRSVCWRGVAHDFNDILTAIIGYGNLVKMKLALNDPAHNYVDQILTSSERAALTHSLLAFSRKQIVEFPAGEPQNEIIVGVGKLLGGLIGEDIEYKMDLDDRELMVLADAGNSSRSS